MGMTWAVEIPQLRLPPDSGISLRNAQGVARGGHPSGRQPTDRPER